MKLTLLITSADEIPSKLRKRDNVQPVKYHEQGRVITIQILKNGEDEPRFSINTDDVIARKCGETLESLIGADSISKVYDLKLPDIQCIDALWQYFRVGQVI